MIIRNSIVLLLLSLACLTVPAQKVELVVAGGMATFSMKDLKKINADVMDQIPFNTKLTDDFPMTFQFGGHFAIQVARKYKMGVLYAFNTTGSRISSADYSGSYQFDNVVTGHSIGMMNGFLVYDHLAFRIDLQANIGVVASVLKMNEVLTITDTTIASAARYTAVGIYVEPRAEFSYQWKNLKTGIYLGYFINPMGRIRNKEGEASSSTINWSGLRFGIEIGFRQADVRPTGF